MDETSLPAWVSAITEPGALLGWRRDGRPILLLAGGAEDDDPDPDPGDDPEPDDDPDDDPEPEPEPKLGAGRKVKPDGDPGDDSTATDLARARAALKKANAEARKHREALAALRKQHESEDEAREREAREAGAKETAAKLKPVAVRASAKAAFLAAGASGDDANVKRLVRLLDLDDVDIDDDGEVSGLDGQVEQIKADYPELFRDAKDAADTGRERRRRPGPADGAGGKKPEDDKPKTSAQRLAALLG